MPVIRIMQRIPPNMAAARTRNRIAAMCSIPPTSCTYNTTNRRQRKGDTYTSVENLAVRRYNGNKATHCKKERLQ